MEELFLVEDGYILNCPIWEKKASGRNHMATIWKDPDAPGGLGRDFVPHGRGIYRYAVGNLAVGQPVEFGCSLQRYGKEPVARRWYGVISTSTDSLFGVTPFEDAVTAINAANALSSASFTLDDQIQQEIVAMEKQLDQLRRRLDMLRNGPPSPEEEAFDQ